MIGNGYIALIDKESDYRDEDRLDPVLPRFEPRVSVD